MPFQPINFANIAPQGNPMLRDLVSSLTEGYKAGQLPGQMKRGQQQEELLNAMNQLKLQQEPERFRGEMQGQQFENALRQAQAQKYQREAEMPFGGATIPGAIGQAVWLSKIRDVYGEDSPQYDLANKAFQAELEKTEALNLYRNALTGTTDKRAATTLGKQEMEIADITSGFMPGSNGRVRLNPEQQQEMLGRFELARQKTSTDSDARKKALFASNIDKTLDQINPESLTQYAGFKGAMSKAFEESKAPAGKESGAYREYQKSLAAAKLLKKQVRQFYGDSITPEIQKSIEELVNPATWKNNPRIALDNFNTIKDILQSETQTYRGALKGINEFESKDAAPRQVDTARDNYGINVDEMMSRPMPGLPEGKKNPKKRLRFNPNTGGFE